ncbi:MAG TPA: NAD-dependent epimerase/dehydratase family protein [Acidimicrobiia bacterium]|nr:NAD-dependent epimerase/dehydratase family protein [Acidimicrobiia bacterium]
MGATGTDDTIVIVGATGQMGTALQQRLGSTRARVRPVSRDDDLAAATRDATVVVHLAGTIAPRYPNTYERANVGTARTTIRALCGTRVRRVVALSSPGANTASSNTFLRTKGQAEALFEECGMPVTTFRCAHIVGTPVEPGPLVTSLLSRGDHPVALLGGGRQRWTPLLREDAIEAIACACLDSTSPTGTFDLGGPDTVTLDDLVDRVNGREVRKRHLHGAAAHVIAALLPSLHPATVEIMAADCVLDSETTSAAFGLSRHGLDSVWPRVGSPSTATP